MGIIQSVTSGVDVNEPVSIFFSSALTAGNRVIVATATRKSYNVISFDAGTWNLRASRFQTSSDAIPGDERGVTIHDLIVPSNDFNSSQFIVDFTGGGESEGSDAMVHAVEISEGSDFVFQDSTTADSEDSEVTSLNTGNTATVPAGDAVVMTISTHRGGTGGGGSPSWSNATLLFHVEDGIGNNDNHSNSGTRFLLSQPSQTYTDAINIPTARQTTVGLAVWVKEASSGQSLTETRTESLTLTEQIDFAINRFLTLQETVGLTDEGIFDTQSVVSENIGLVDLVSIELGELHLVTESIGITDFASFQDFSVIVEDVSLIESIIVQLITGGPGVVASLVDAAITWLDGLGYSTGTIQDRQHAYLVDQYVLQVGPLPTTHSLTVPDLQIALSEKVRFILRQSEFV